MREAVSTKSMTYEDWLTLRRTYIGGTDAAAISGLSPWRGPAAVWREKVLGQSGDATGNKRILEMGRRLEPVARDLFREEVAEKKGWRVIERHAILFHPQWEIAGANVDGIIQAGPGNQGIWEGKTTAAWNEKAWEQGGIPTQYVAQVQWYLFVTGYQFAWLTCIFGGQDVRHYEIRRDDAQIARMEDACKRFWLSYTVPGIVPPPSLADGADYKDVLPDRGAPDEIKLPGACDAAIFELADLKSQARDIDGRITFLENHLKYELRDHEKGVTPQGKAVSFKEQKGRVTIDARKLAAEYPQAYGECARVGESFRVLRVGK